jgi:hypothetical protein
VTACPLVSCLMVTGGGAERYPWLTSAIGDYCRQSYSPTELVIVLDQGTGEERRRLEATVAAFRRPDIRLMPAPGKLSLGALRNVSMENASGPILCLWDDDDIHHPRRIELQMARLLGAGADAVLLSDCLHLFMAEGHCYWADWASTRSRGLPGSLLARRHGFRYPESGPRAATGEDTDLLWRLRDMARVELLPAPPLLYVYRFHGANTWQRRHHALVASQLGRPREGLQRDRAALEASLAEMDLGIQEVTMVDADGPVFTVPSRGPAPTEARSRRSRRA